MSVINDNYSLFHFIQNFQSKVSFKKKGENKMDEKNERENILFQICKNFIFCGISIVKN